MMINYKNTEKIQNNKKKAGNTNIWRHKVQRNFLNDSMKGKKNNRNQFM